jgi:hypothetical protein
MPLLYGADASNWEAMAELAARHKTALGVIAPNLEGLAELTEKIKAKGVEDLVLDPGGRTFGSGLALCTQIRCPLGYPVIVSWRRRRAWNRCWRSGHRQYAGFIVLDNFT